MLTKIGFKICMLRAEARPFLAEHRSIKHDYAVFTDPKNMILAAFGVTPTQESLAKLAHLCARARNLDEQIETFFKSLPQEWLPTHILVNDNEAETWSGLVHFFQRPLASLFFMFAYTLRIITNGLLVNMSKLQGEPCPPHSIHQIWLAVDNISAVVPYVFGCRQLGLPFKQYFVDDLAWQRALGVFLLRPLFVAASVGDIISLKQRKWLKGKIEYAHSTVGFHSANILANELSF